MRRLLMIMLMLAGCQIAEHPALYNETTTCRQTVRRTNRQDYEAAKRS